MAENAHELGAAFGFLYQAEIDALQDLVKNLPAAPRIVNIGAGAGTSSLSMVEARPTAVVYTVDISTGGPLGGMENELNAFINAGIPERLPVQVLGDSSAIGRHWKHGPLDLVFVDGDHSEIGVRADIEAWLPLVKPGGVIVFHDYGRDHWPKVCAVVDEMMAGYEVLVQVETLIAFKVDHDAA